MMKKILSLSATILLPALCSAQIKFGGSIFYGFGGVKNMGSIQKYYDMKIAEKKDIKVYTFTNNTGSVFGLNLKVGYEINEMMMVNSGLQIQRMKNTFDMYKYEDKDKNQKDDIRVNVSTVTLYMTSFSIPFTLKARFLERKVKPFAEAGLSMEIRLSKTIDGVETRTDSDKNGKVDKIQYYEFKDKVLDGFPGSGFNLIIGGGVEYSLDDKKALTFGVHYTSAFSQTVLWSKNLESGSGNDVGDNNKIFDKSQQDTRYSSDGILIDDWKESSIAISVGIIF